MAEGTQILIIVVVVTLTIILSIVGLQIILILKEARQMLTRANKVFDEAGDIVGNVNANLVELRTKIAAASGLAGLVSIAKALKSLARSLRRREKT